MSPKKGGLNRNGPNTLSRYLRETTDRCRKYRGVDTVNFFEASRDPGGIPSILVCGHLLFARFLKEGYRPLDLIEGLSKFCANVKIAISNHTKHLEDEEFTRFANFLSLTMVVTIESYAGKSGELANYTRELSRRAQDFTYLFAGGSDHCYFRGNHEIRLTDTSDRELLQSDVCVFDSAKIANALGVDLLQLYCVVAMTGCRFTNTCTSQVDAKRKFAILKKEEHKVIDAILKLVKVFNEINPGADVDDYIALTRQVSRHTLTATRCTFAYFLDMQDAHFDYDLEAKVPSVGKRLTLPYVEAFTRFLENGPDDCGLTERELQVISWRRRTSFNLAKGELGGTEPVSASPVRKNVSSSIPPATITLPPMRGARISSPRRAPFTTIRTSPASGSPASGSPASGSPASGPLASVSAAGASAASTSATSTSPASASPGSTFCLSKPKPQADATSSWRRQVTSSRRDAKRFGGRSPVRVTQLQGGKAGGPSRRVEEEEGHVFSDPKKPIRDSSLLSVSDAKRGGAPGVESARATGFIVQDHAPQFNPHLATPKHTAA